MPITLDVEFLFVILYIEYSKRVLQQQNIIAIKKLSMSEKINKLLNLEVYCPFLFVIFLYVSGDLMLKVNS